MAEGTATKWKLTGIWLVAAVLIFILVTPLFSLSVKVELPPSATGIPSPQQIASGSHLMMGVATVVIFTVDALLIGLVLWIAAKLTPRLRQKHSA